MRIMETVEGQPAVASETRKPSKEAAPPLFDLTSLQREGNRRYGWSARRTLNAAQRCYESHKVPDLSSYGHQGPAERLSNRGR